jgi:hypothetical protein
METGFEDGKFIDLAQDLAERQDVVLAVLDFRYPLPMNVSWLLFHVLQSVVLMLQIYLQTRFLLQYSENERKIDNLAIL